MFGLQIPAPPRPPRAGQKESRALTYVGRGVALRIWGKEKWELEISLRLLSGRRAAVPESDVNLPALLTSLSLQAGVIEAFLVFLDK